MCIVHIILVLLAIDYSTTNNTFYPKCCESVNGLKEISDGYYRCSDVQKTRYQINTNITGFFNGNASDLCIDNTGKIGIFRENSNNTFVKIEEISEEIQPKCCPLGHHYDFHGHSCKDSGQEFDGRIVKVGLDNCRIIVDYHFNSTDEFKRNGKRIRFLDSYKEYEEGFYCIDKDVADRMIIVRVCEDTYDLCNHIKCVHKCCPDGQSFINGSNCKDTYVHGFDLNFSDRIENPEEPFAIIHGRKCLLYPLAETLYDFHLDTNGVFSMYESRVNTSNRYPVERETYCIEHARKGKMDKFMFFRCFEKFDVEIKFKYTRWAMIISCIFLLLTILYYLMSNEKRNLFGKTLISYCTAMFFTFFLLSYVAFNSLSDRLCQTLGFMLVYGSLVSFFWMNIMCIDIYWTFGSPKSFSCAQHKNKEWKRFMWYSLYGWGFPIIITMTALIFYHIDVLPSFLSIIIGMKKCYIQKGDGNYAEFLFVAIPTAILEIVNIILFIKTVIYCMKVKGEISKMNDTQILKGEKSNYFNKYKDRLNLLLKLFIIMGISFLFEAISSFYDFKQNTTTSNIELVWDTINSLQGLFIFMIFICKKKVFDSCQKKFGVAKIRKFSLNSAVTVHSNVSTMGHNNVNRGN